MDAERRAQIRDRCEKATPGPWDGERGWIDGGDRFPATVMINPGYEDEYRIYEGPFDADAAFIAEARTDIPDLLAENDRLRGAIRAHREAYGGIEMPCPHELRAANRQLWATIEEKDGT